MSDTNPLAVPRRIEWPAPSGWTIWADEDGVHIRTPKGDALEMPEVLRLIETYEAIKDSLVANQIPKPAPPNREQRVAMLYEDRCRYEARRAADALYAQLTNDIDNPPIPF